MPEKKRSINPSAAASTISERPVLDLGEASRNERARAFEAFERLPPGGSFEVSAHRQLVPLFSELQARYGLGFHWWPLEPGPFVWRVTLAKPSPDARLTVASAMAAYHLHLYELWREFELTVDRCQIDTVHRLVRELSLGLRRYIDLEEFVLFPLLDAQTETDGGGSTAAMRSEHREIERVVDRFAIKLNLARDCATILEEFDRPVEPMALFQSHYRQEEAILYPIMNKVFGHAEQMEILSLMQSFEL